MSTRSGARFLRADEHPSGEEEQRELEAVLRGAPASIEPEYQGRHSRGGYWVSFNVESGALDQFCDYILASGWRIVM